MTKSTTTEAMKQFVPLESEVLFDEARESSGWLLVPLARPILTSIGRPADSLLLMALAVRGPDGARIYRFGGLADREHFERQCKCEPPDRFIITNMAHETAEPKINRILRKKLGRHFCPMPAQKTTTENLMELAERLRCGQGDSEGRTKKFEFADGSKALVVTQPAVLDCRGLAVSHMRNVAGVFPVPNTCHGTAMVSALRITREQKSEIEEKMGPVTWAKRPLMVAVFRR